MPTLIYVPGFSASELAYNRDGTRVLWLSYSRLILDTPAALTLDAAGDPPGGDRAVPLYPTGVLTAYWREIADVLNSQLQPRGFSVEYFAWDWRRDLWLAGTALADRVRQLRGSALPVTLCGHSAGGLVCRAAWAQLSASDRDTRVRRIICVASPHCGTYYAVNTFAGVSEFMTQLAQLNQITGGSFGSWVVFYSAAWGVTDLVDVACTWPALYQLLPVAGGSDAGTDPNRLSLYTATEWHGLPVRISQRHLTTTRILFHSFLLDPSSRPPAHVMTVVSGRGTSTPATLDKPDRLGLTDAIGSTDEGDGTVTVASAEDNFPVVVKLTGRHSDLPWALVSSGMMLDLILDERAPVPSPASVTVDTTPIPVRLGGPPIPTLSLAGVYPADCRAGRCFC